MSGNKLVLIDGHSLAYRAYNALPQEMRTARGELTNAVFGFASMLITVWRDVQPDYIAVAFDVGRTFRHDVYPAYKAHRKEHPEDINPQMERIVQVINAFNLPVFTLPNFEADDVLGALSLQAEEQGLETVIVTGDRDALQLVDEHVRVLTSGRRFSDTIVYDEAAVRARYGIAPTQLVDYKGLVGDVSDNIPGVKGIGEKTATGLLQAYGTLEGIYEHLDEIKNKRAHEALASQREAAFLSRNLARIVREAPIQLADVEQCRAGDFDRNKVVILFRELEFRSLLNRLPLSTRQKPQRPPADQLSLFGDEGAAAAVDPGESSGLAVEAVEAAIAEEVSGEAPEATPEELAEPELLIDLKTAFPGRYAAAIDRTALESLAADVREAGAFSFDVETTSEDPWTAECVGLSISPRPGEGYYVPLGHTGGDAQATLPDVAAALGPLFADPELPKYAHNAKYDLAVLERMGMEVRGLAFDTMLGEFLLNPAGHNLALKNLAWARLGVEMTPLTDLIGTGKAQIGMSAVAVERVAPYAAADADVTLRLVQPLERELKAKALWRLFTDVEMPLISVLMGMERTGIALDTAFLAELSVDMKARLADLERQIQEMVGHAFNIASTEQLSDALFITLGLPKIGAHKTKSGRYSTAADVLEGLRGKHLVIDLILEHRQLSKLKSTYIDALPLVVSPVDGRLHTSFNQTGAVTGRLSSSEPNLQNIPIRTDVGRQVRRAFIAKPGCLLLAADYSQVELRILAHVSNDPAMLEAFRRGEDIHRSTAAAIFGVPLDQVTSDMRRVAKTTNFAISYGVTGFGLARQTGLTTEEAQLFIDSYFAQFPGVRDYVEGTKAQAGRDGYVETLLGRRRYFPELQAAAQGRKIAHNVRLAAERMAINAPIQGSAADIIKIAMIRLDERLREAGLDSRMVLQVHDELILDVPESEVDRVAPIVCETMEGAFPLQVPLKVDLSSGANWLDMKGIE